MAPAVSAPAYQTTPTTVISSPAQLPSVPSMVAYPAQAMVTAPAAEPAAAPLGTTITASLPSAPSMVAYP
eukprot:CAMPEP_0175271582 /NCGR_PEP_ID=MMETSP0093-20121207/45983_1 /TAXON_ID=311494 /ORGANISM="Alexandrium monilatum, Strain CCMP3105" /LENGTH=69 /DNA_ID=CAMNT_0016566343 /DNA_START=15 /DNA_END=221 /DNA_ORIENTATION=-